MVSSGGRLPRRNIVHPCALLRGNAFEMPKEEHFDYQRTNSAIGSCFRFAKRVKMFLRLNWDGVSFSGQLLPFQRHGDGGSRHGPQHIGLPDRQSRPRPRGPAPKPNFGHRRARPVDSTVLGREGLFSRTSYRICQGTESSSSNAHLSAVFRMPEPMNRSCGNFR